LGNPGQFKHTCQMIVEAEVLRVDEHQVAAKREPE
jgi:hypothetical protein